MVLVVSKLTPRRSLLCVTQQIVLARLSEGTSRVGVSVGGISMTGHSGRGNDL